MPNPGDTRTIIQRYTRLGCEVCGEDATKRYTFLLENARRNPASKGYGKDDISWCSDGEVFCCDLCRPEAPDGMRECSTFSFGDRFPHMFHAWSEVSRVETQAAAPDLAALAIAQAAEIERLTNNRDMWKSQSERQAVELERLRTALKEIAERHIPDQPSAYGGDELSWATRQYANLRRAAFVALKGETP